MNTLQHVKFEKHQSLLISPVSPHVQLHQLLLPSETPFGQRLDRVPREVHGLQLAVELEGGVHGSHAVAREIQPLERWVQSDGDDLQVRPRWAGCGLGAVVAVAEVGAEGGGGGSQGNGD